MICTQKCPNFIIDLERIQTDEDVYLKRCMKNHKFTGKTYKILDNIDVTVKQDEVYWSKNEKTHRDNDKPAIFWFTGSRHWYKNGKLHRSNKPAIIWFNGTEEWFKNGVEYEPM
jgi:hypothetical protein